MRNPDFRHYPLDTECMPTGWEPAVVGDVALEIRPGFASGKHNQTGDGVPHIRPMNIDRLGCIDLSQVKSVNSQSNPLRLRTGNVLFNNTNSPALVGKTAAITQEEDWAFSNHMTRIVLDDSMDNQFLAHQLHYLWMRGYFRHKCVNHVNQASVSSTALSDTVPLLIAPTNEQRRIVAKIEELFSDLDAGVKALERARANLKRYRAAVLKAAVEGKLTEPWRAEHPDAEPASELLQRILLERRRRWEEDQLVKYKAKGKQPPKGWRERYKEPAPPDTSNLPALPAGWCWASIEQLTTNSLNGFGKRSQKNGKPRIVLRLADIILGKVSLESPRKVNALPEEIAKYSLQPHDLLSIRVNGSPDLVGRLILFEEDENEVLFCDHFIKIRASLSELAKWIRIYGDCSPARKHIAQNKVSSAGQNTISQGTLDEMAIPLPPLDEGRVICAELDRINSIISENVLLVEHNLLRSFRLRQSILKQAFEGKLVPQDPNDEPAEELLARIAAERKAAYEQNGAPKKKRPTKKKAAAKQ